MNNADRANNQRNVSNSAKQNASVNRSNSTNDSESSFQVNNAQQNVSNSAKQNAPSHSNPPGFQLNLDKPQQNAINHANPLGSGFQVNNADLTNNQQNVSSSAKQNTSSHSNLSGFQVNLNNPGPNGVQLQQDDSTNYANGSNLDYQNQSNFDY